jgi:general secretion pathway protein K
MSAETQRLRMLMASAGRRRQNGIALVTAIFVVALATIAAAAMFESINVSLHRTNNLQGSEQSQWYAISIESWVCSILQRASPDLRGRGYLSLSDPWAQPISLPIDHGAAGAKLEDLQGRFNINNFGALNPTPYMEQFQRLLQYVPGANSPDAGALAAAIRDWVDFDSQPWGGLGAEDIYYMSLPHAYRTSNRLMKSPSELLLVRGMTRELYDAIYPYVTTLPTTSAKINVNTAPLPVLESLSGDATGLSQFAAGRDFNPATSVQNLISRDVLPKNSTMPTFIDVTSYYFQLQTIVEADGVRLKLFSTIIWPASGRPIVIARSFGAD